MLVVSAYALTTHVTAIAAEETQIHTVEPLPVVFIESGQSEEAPAEIEQTEPQFIPMDCPLGENLQRLTWDECQRMGVDFTLAMAVMQQESDFHTNVISGTNDYGLMQINKCNHSELKKKLGLHDLMDPGENIRAGVYMLSELVQKYQEPHLALMVYNMGESTAKRLWSKGIYSSRYSRSVVQIRQGMDAELETKTVKETELPEGIYNQNVESLLMVKNDG